MSDQLKPYQFKKGNPGGPGRPKNSKQIPAMLRKFGAMDCPEKFIAGVKKSFPNIKKLTMIEAVMLRVYQDAIKGQSWATNFIADRTEGKPAQAIIGDDEHGEVKINFTMHSNVADNSNDKDV